MPTFPFASIKKAVEVAEAVEVEIANKGMFDSRAVEVAATDKRADGEVEPIPKLPAEVISTFSVSGLPVVNLMEPATFRAERIISSVPVLITKSPALSTLEKAVLPADCPRYVSMPVRPIVQAAEVTDDPLVSVAYVRLPPPSICNFESGIRFVVPIPTEPAKLETAVVEVAVKFAATASPTTESLA